ncbi:MAG: aminopeptidase [Clostridia bacterium]|nr:aminopeptidase [Clostridia bacterium]
MSRKPYLPSSRRIPELDGLRVILVFIVSWYHFWQQSWLTPYIGGVSLDFLVRSGYMPVDGTILLSAFLLFLPYARSMSEGDPIPDRTWFYRRRIMRVVPSFYFVTLAMLFLVAIPWKLHYSPQFLVKDVFTHLTFTFTFWPDTYISTQIGVASWTLAIEMQAYLLYPFLARCAMKRPKTTLCAMAAISWLWRGWCLWALTDFSMVVNQLPSFLDVYALGMLASMVYVRLTKMYAAAKTKPRRALWQIAATALGALCVWGLILTLKAQASSGSYENIQAGQLMRRPLFASLLTGLVLALPFAVKPVRFLFGNRLMKELAAVSLNYYLVHQNLAVHLKRLGIPPSRNVNPHMAAETAWQYPYTYLCFGLSLLLAFLITYLVEKPCARLLKKLFMHYDKRRKAKMKDPRMITLAHNLVNYSCSVQPGEKVWIEGTGIPSEFIAQLVEEVYAAGGVPFVQLRDPRVERAMGMGYTEEQLKWLAEGDGKRMSECQAYIGVRGGDNMYETGDVPAERSGLYSRFYSSKVHGQIRVPQTKWVVLRYPTPSMAQQAGMSTEAFEEHFFNVCNLDYGKMSRAMDALVERLNNADQVHITGKGTDLTFSIKGLPGIKCDGKLNIPDGEVFSAPVVGSINGVITYNAPSLYQGKVFENIRLVFKDGYIVEATCNDTETLNKIFDTDPGARAVGEFAIGVNPYITSAIKDTLFDEKIAGSFHFTPGRCYDECDNGNQSAIHWDLVCIQTPEYGGGEMWFDGELIRKDGLFIPEDLQPLNPENLK